MISDPLTKKFALAAAHIAYEEHGFGHQDGLLSAHVKGSSASGEDEMFVVVRALGVYTVIAEFGGVWHFETGDVALFNEGT